jgi:hypothetical protein
MYVGLVASPGVPVPPPAYRGPADRASGRSRSARPSRFVGPAGPAAQPTDEGAAVGVWCPAGQRLGDLAVDAQVPARQDPGVAEEHPRGPAPVGSWPGVRRQKDNPSTRVTAPPPVLVGSVSGVQAP